MKRTVFFYYIMFPFTILFALEPARVNLEPEAKLRVMRNCHLLKLFLITMVGKARVILLELPHMTIRQMDVLVNG